MIETPRQTTRPPHVTNPPLDAVAKTLRRAEPRLAFAPLPAFRLEAGLRQADAAHAPGARMALVLWRVDAAIAADLPRGFAKQPAMPFQGRPQLLGIGRIAGQDAILADQPALDLGVPNLVPELGLLWFGFAPTNDGGVGLEQTDHLVAGRDRLAVQDPLSGLLDHPLHQRHIGVEQLVQAE